MSVEVNFRGVGLFTTVERNNTRVLDAYAMPNTRESKGKLPLHYARLVVLDSLGNIVSRHNLDGTTVQVADAFGGDCVLQSSFARVQDFHEAIKATLAAIKAKQAKASRSRVKLKTADVRLVEYRVATGRNGSKTTSNVTSLVRISGGAMSANEQQGPWRTAQDHAKGELDPHAGPAAHVAWRSNAPTATISIATEEGTVTSLVLDANRPKAFLYHYDDEWASVAQLSGFDDAGFEDARAESASDGSIADHDFKWLYWMTNVDPATHWEELKAPYVKQHEVGALRARNPGSSAGCFPAAYAK